MAAVAGGDLESLGTLYKRHSAMLKRAMLRTAPEMPADEAEELTQDLFILLASKAADYESRMKARAYLYGIAVKKASAWRRKTWLRRKLLSREQQATTLFGPSTEPGLAEQVARRQVIQTALSRLPEKQRAVLLLYTVEGFSGEEISDILRIPKETVRTRLFRARQALVKHASRKSELSVLREEAS